jgi:hypothetical protein
MVRSYDKNIAWCPGTTRRVPRSRAVDVVILTMVGEQLQVLLVRRSAPFKDVGHSRGFNISGADWKAELRGAAHVVLRSPGPNRFLVAALRAAS